MTGINVFKNNPICALLSALLLMPAVLKAQFYDYYSNEPGPVAAALRNSDVDTVFYFYGGDSGWRFVEAPIKYIVYQGPSYSFWIKNGHAYIRKHFSFQKRDLKGTTVLLQSPAVRHDSTKVFQFIFSHEEFDSAPEFGHYFYWVALDSARFVTKVWQSHSQVTRLEVVCGPSFNATHFENWWTEPFHVYEFYDSLVGQTRRDTCCHNLNYQYNMNNPWKRLFDVAWREIVLLEEKGKLPLAPVKPASVQKRRRKR